jgi:hypothetical protein
MDRRARLTAEIGSAGHGVQVVRAAGRLSQATVTALKHAAEKALAEQPDLLVLDLSRVVLVDRLGAHVLPLIAAQAAVWPVTRVAVAGAAREVQRDLRGRSGIGPLSWFPDVDAAIATGTTLPAPLLARVALPARASAAAVARDAVAQLCAGEIRDRVQVVVSELVNNAVQHGRPPLELRVHATTRLHVSVRDGEPFLAPRAGAGYGLDVVRRFATVWGWRRIPDGKVVWAVVGPHRHTRPSVRLTCPPGAG